MTFKNWVLKNLERSQDDGMPALGGSDFPTLEKSLRECTDRHHAYLRSLLVIALLFAGTSVGTFLYRGTWEARILSTLFALAGFVTLGFVVWTIREATRFETTFRLANSLGEVALREVFEVLLQQYQRPQGGQKGSNPSTPHAPHGSNTGSRSPAPVVYLAYSPKDQSYRDELLAHLKVSAREARFQIWHDGCIQGGEDPRQEISKHIQDAHVVLFLISPDFIATGTRYQIDVSGALERYGKGETRIVPILIRPAIWKSMEYGHLQPLPEKPVSDCGLDRDQVWVQVAAAIKTILSPGSQER